MVNAPQAGGYQITGEAGGKTGQQRLMADQPDGDDLQAEYRSGQRSAEDGAEAAADAAHQQDSAVQRTDSEPASECVGQTAAHLHGRAFASGRAAEEMGNQRPAKNQRGHAQRNRFIALADLLQDQIVTLQAALAVTHIHSADERASYRKQEEQPGMLQPYLGDRIQTGQEQGRGASCQQPDHSPRITHLTNVLQSASWLWRAASAAHRSYFLFTMANAPDPKYILP